MAILSKFQRGEVITAEKLNQLVDAIQECQIQSVVGGYFKRGPGGSTITISPSQKVSGTAQSAQQCPFDMTLGSTPSGAAITVKAGLINGVIPSQILVPLNVSTSSLQYVCIDCDTNGMAVVSASINIKSSPPAIPAHTAEVAPTTFSYIIGVVTNGQAYKTIGCSNITVPILPTLSEDRLPYEAGARNFTQYYNWGI